MSKVSTNCYYSSSEYYVSCFITIRGRSIDPLTNNSLLNCMFYTSCEQEIVFVLICRTISGSQLVQKHKSTKNQSSHFGLIDKIIRQKIVSQHYLSSCFGKTSQTSLVSFTTSLTSSGIFKAS